MKKNIILIFLVSATAVLSTPAAAQRNFNNPISQYFRNDYLWNPAMAGKEGTRLYGLLNRSWIGFDGAPKQITFSADMKAGDKSGVGLQLSSDKSGAFQRLMGAVSYAYVATLSEKNSLRIGGDLSFYKESLDNNSITGGGQYDASGKAFNDKGMEFNGDLGITFEGTAFSIGATGYNLRAYLQKPEDRSADLAVGQLMTSYKFTCENGKVTIQPLIAYKMYYKHDDILTAAVQLQYDHAFHAGIYWQNTGNAMGGIGLMLKELGEINFFYSGKNKYGYNQQYEVGLKVLLNNKNQQ